MFQPQRTQWAHCKICNIANFSKQVLLSTSEVVNWINTHTFMQTGEYIWKLKFYQVCYFLNPPSNGDFFIASRLHESLKLWLHFYFNHCRMRSWHFLSNHTQIILLLDSSILLAKQISFSYTNLVLAFSYNTQDRAFSSNIQCLFYIILLPQTLIWILLWAY